MKRLLLGLVALTLTLMAAPAAAQERIIQFVYPPLTEYCYTVNGHWTFDGFQYVWVPSRTFCDYR